MKKPSDRNPIIEEKSLIDELYTDEYIEAGTACTEQRELLKKVPKEHRMIVPSYANDGTALGFESTRAGCKSFSYLADSTRNGLAEDTGVLHTGYAKYFRAMQPDDGS